MPRRQASQQANQTTSTGGRSYLTSTTCARASQSFIEDAETADGQKPISQMATRTKAPGSKGSQYCPLQKQGNWKRRKRRV